MKYRPRLRAHARRRLLLITIIVCVLTVVAAFTAQAKLTRRTDRHFDADTKEHTTEFVDRLELYSSALNTGKSLLVSDPSMSQEKWDTFFKAQGFEKNLPGVSAIAYVEVIPNEDVDTFFSTLRQVPYFKTASLKPTGSRPEYAIASLVSSHNNLTSSLGFDNYSTQDRKQTYELAAATGRAIVSPPLNLATGAKGFFMTIPATSVSNKIVGFITMSLRTDDFIKNLHGKHEIGLFASQIEDVTNPKNPIILYQTGDWSTVKDELRRSDTITIAGRQWQLNYRSARAYDDSLLNKYIPLIIMSAGAAVILAISLSYTLHTKTREIKHLKERQNGHD